MATLYRSYQKPKTQQLTLEPVRSLKPTNSSNPQLKTMDSRTQQVRRTIEQTSIRQKSSLENTNKQLKKYCLSKLKPTQSTEKFNPVRKNRSLKYLTKEKSVQLINRTKLEQGSTQGLCLLGDSSSYKSSLDKNRTISIKRRVELIKKNQNKLKLSSGKDSQNTQEKPSDSSLCERLESTNLQKQASIEDLEKFLPKFPSEQNYERFLNENRIQSENMLGQGLKKCSSSKIKIMVRNPFQKLMKMEESRQRQSLKPPSIEDMEQSRILPPLDQTTTSMGQRYQIEEMLKMM